MLVNYFSTQYVKNKYKKFSYDNLYLFDNISIYGSFITYEIEAQVDHCSSSPAHTK